MQTVKSALRITAIALAAAACGKPTANPPSTVTVTVTATVTATPTTTVELPHPLLRLDSAGGHWSGKWIWVTVSVSNISSGPQPFVVHDQRLVDGQGREFAPDTRETSAAGEVDRQEVNPGKSFRSDIYFDVPTGTQVSDYRLVLHDSAGVFATVQLEVDTSGRRQGSARILPRLGRHQLALVMCQRATSISSRLIA